MVPVLINGTHRTQAMIDSGATGNFITSDFVKTRELPTMQHTEPYQLHMFNGQVPEDGRITRQTRPLPMNMKGGHHEEIVFDITKGANHAIVLGLPWLTKHNPVMDWKKKVLTFRGCRRATDIYPTQRQRSKVDEKGNHLCQVSPSTTADPREDANSSDTAKGTADQQKDRGSGSSTPAIPREYQRFRSLFEEESLETALPKHRSWDHEIPLEPGKQPTFGPIYQQSAKELAELKQYIETNEAKGFIRKSTSSAASPVLFVPKKNGKLRLCVDYRKLNLITKKNRYPLPNIHELQDRITGAQVFTSLDLKGAYNLIRMKEGEEWKTAFRTRYGLYEYLVMPFGLTNAPATCQSYMNHVLQRYLDDFVVVYLDDILIYSRNMEDHRRHVTLVMTALSQESLKLELEKCEFHKESLPYLGVIVGRTGVQIDPAKTKSTREWPQPTNVKEMQSFLGFANYNRRFIKDYSKISAPLSDLTKKDQEYKWEEKHTKAFKELKKCFENPPLLKTFDPEKPLRIETDASDLAIGACITQQHEGRWHPLAYHSRKMTPAEQGYDIHDKELLAIVEAVKVWRPYVEGHDDVEILTDHKNLISFTSTKVLNRRQVRWSETLSQYQLKINYRPGAENGRADALSRRTDLMDKEVISQGILAMNKDGSLSPVKSQELNSTERGSDRSDNQIIRDHHDDPTRGHPGVTKTIELIQRNFKIQGIRRKVEKYIQNCQKCQQNKHNTQAQYGAIQPLAATTYPWEEMSMDFVVKLPRSEFLGQTYDSILVVVDRFSKYAHFLPCNESQNATQMAMLLSDRIVRYHGIPKAIISDRDKLFTSKYWKSLMEQLGVKQKMSTAFHPQTDGQTERTNKTMEQYLRIFANEEQDNWAQLLPTAQMAYNNVKSDTTGVTPFKALYGMDLPMFGIHPAKIQNEDATFSATEMSRVHELIKQRIENKNISVSKRLEGKRRQFPMLQPGDKVYVSTKNMQSKQPSKKLSKLYTGPFSIKAIKGKVNFELNLPKTMRKHPVFHVSLLKPAPREAPTVQETTIESDKEYQVEKILGKNSEGKYLIKWKGYENSENTWEPSTNLTNCQDLLQRFHQQTGQPGQRTSQPRDPRLRKTREEHRR